MRYYLEGQSEVELPASSVAELLSALAARYPSLSFHLLDSDGNLRRHFNVFVNGVHIRELNGLTTPLHPQDKVILMASASGGKGEAGYV